MTAGFSSVWSPVSSFFVLLSTENSICKKKNDQRQLKGTENLLEGRITTGSKRWGSPGDGRGGVNVGDP